MQKWKYEIPEMKILAVDADVVTLSGGGITGEHGGDNEGNFGDLIGGGSTKGVPAVDELEI